MKKNKSFRDIDPDKWASDAWIPGNPPEHGYYLAAWGDGVVSELWYNPTNGWWTSRGYLQAYDGQRNWCHVAVPGVYAWMPMPKAPTFAKQLDKGDPT